LEASGRKGIAPSRGRRKEKDTTLLTLY
jgi:hypothetical protein